MRKINEIDDMFFDTLRQNGWGNVRRESPWMDLDTYKLTIRLDYEIECYIRVSSDEDGLKYCGQFGVYDIDVQCVEYEPPYEYEVLMNMMKAIDCAEKNLLAVGVPFTRSGEFHGPDVADKKKRNDELRKAWGLDESEQEWKDKMMKEGSIS